MIVFDCGKFLRRSSLFLLSNSRRATTCTLSLDPPPPSTSPAVSAASGDHFSYCLSLIKELVERDRVDDARKVTGRVISGCSSETEAFSIVYFAIQSGLGLDSGCFGGLIRKLTELGQAGSAEAFYRATVIGNGIVPDLSILNSMVICLVKLGKFHEARVHFDRILESGSVPSEDDCSSVLGELLKQEQFLEAFYYFVRVDEMGVRLGLWCCKKLFKGLCCQGHLDEAVEMLNPLCEITGMPLPLNLYKSLFYGHCRRGRALDAELLFGHMEADGYFVDKVMYTFLMKEYCKDKKMKMAMRVYFRMLKKGFEPDHYVFNTLIHGFAKARLFGKGRVIFNQMMEKGMQPTVFTYHSMIRSYCEEGNVGYALAFLENTVTKDVSPNVHCYTSLIAALLKDNRFNEAYDLYVSSLENGVPDHILFFILSKMTPKGLQLELALSTLMAIAKNGCGIDPSSILKDLEDIDAKFESLLKNIAGQDVNLAASGLAIVTTALCAQRNSDSALKHVDKMVSLGCRPLVFSYNSVIKCLCQDGRFEDSESLIHLMRERGTIADQDTYLVMVNEYCRRGYTDSAFDLVVEMEETGLRPTVAIYDSIIGSLGRKGRVIEAEDTFLRMLESGIEPDELAHQTAFHAFAYARNENINGTRELPEEIVKHSVGPKSYAYTKLISGFVKRNGIDIGCFYLDRILGDGFFPNIVLFTSLIGHFFKKGDYEFSVRLADVMIRNQIELDPIIYITLLSGVCRVMAGRERPVATSLESKEDKERLLRLLCRNPVSHESTLMLPSRKSFAWMLIERVKKSPFLPNLYIYNAIISCFCEDGKMEEAYNHLESMRREGIDPNHVTFTILMKGHIKNCEIDSAISLFNRTSCTICKPDKVMYNTLLRGLCDARRPGDALTLAYTMQKRGHNPNRVSYEKLLHCLCASGLTTPACEILGDMLVRNITPSSLIQNWLFCILCEEKKFGEAHALYDVMVQCGIDPLKWNKQVLEKTSNKYKKIGFIHPVNGLIM